MKHKANKDGIVYSTNPDFVFDEEEETITLEPAKQNLRVMLDKNNAPAKSYFSDWFSRL